jgi:hypothetical protein
VTTVLSGGQQDLDDRDGACSSPQHKSPQQHDIASGSSDSEDRFHSGEDKSLQLDYADEEARWRRTDQKDNQGEKGAGQQKDSASNACEFLSLQIKQKHAQ